MSKYTKLYPVIMKSLNVKRARMYQILKKWAKDTGFTLTQDEVVLLLASKVGIDISKIGTPEELDKIRQSQMVQPITIQQRPPREIKEKKLKVIRVSPDLEVSDPLLPNKTITKAKEMAQVYIRLYVFENSIRNVIKMVMEKAHGRNWWDQVHPKIQERVADRKAKESKNPWHGKRGSHEIFYTLFSDLLSIIRNNWKKFEDLFPDQNWVITRIGEIEPSRNVIAHNNPLSGTDIERIRLYSGDWERQIKGIKEKI
jgi:hypothetical protein